MPHPEGYLLRAIRHLPAKSRSGIYAGKHIEVANRTSSEFEIKSKKYVKPNVQKCRLYSQALGRKVQLNVTTTALRAIDAAGGLDRYLLKTPDSLLHSDVASDLKFRLSLIYRHKLHQQQTEMQQKQLQGKGRPQLAAAGKSNVLLQSSSQATRRKQAASLLPPAAAALQQAARPQ